MSWAALLGGWGCSAGGAKGNGATVGDRSVSSSGNTGRDVDLGGGNLLPGSNGPDFGTDVATPPTGDVTGIPECEQCTDFPAQPLFEGGLGPDVQAVFDQAASGTPPCIIEPADGMLIPANMLRPRVRFSGGGSLHQITLHTGRELNDLVVYTTKSTWSIPPEMWQGLSRNVFEEDITITVKTTTGNAAPSQSQTKFRIAPVPAGGNVIYWAATSEQPGLKTTRLLGFGVGEEAVVTVLQPTDIKDQMLDDNGRLKRVQYDAALGQARCVGCHTSTGDGKAVITGDHWPWNMAISDITKAGGGKPADVTDFGAFLLQMPWLGVSTTSRGDWALNNRRLVTSAGPRNAMNADFTTPGNTPQQDMGFGGGGMGQSGKDLLIWIKLNAEGTVPPYAGDQYEKGIGTAMIGAKGTGWGVVARDQDPRGAVTPDWSHDGKTIAYTSTDGTQDGHVGSNANQADIFTVPFGEGKGGVASPVQGANLPDVGEYYPDFSADDRFIAFTRVQDRQGRPYYYHDRSEIYVVPASGGTAVRLAANDPPACTNERSPGILNSWPKWSPTVRTGPEGTPSAGKKYYFLLFSSARQSPLRLGQAPGSQLYLATVVEQPNGELLTYPAMYLWNQAFEIINPAMDYPDVVPVQTSNLTPAFDEFVIPARPPVIVR